MTLGGFYRAMARWLDDQVIICRCGPRETKRMAELAIKYRKEAAVADGAPKKVKLNGDSNAEHT